MNSFRLVLFALLLWLLSPMGIARDSSLKDYITLGLRGNLALQQENLSLEKSLKALKEAKGLFFPNISIQARYSRAGGGRLIEIPIGDLTNPVFQSLNQLYSFHGIITNFPTNIPNDVVPFLRKSEQDTKLRVIQPLYQPALMHNFKLRSNLAKSEEFKLEALKRQLIADIKTAYFTHLKTLQVEQLLGKTKDLLQENLRVSRTLYNNGMATEDIIFRAEAEVAALDQKIAEAENNTMNSSAYFNFLLNRDLSASIQTDFDTSFEKYPIDLDSAARSALLHRDEFRQLDSTLKATRSQLDLAASGSLPSLSLVVDLGIQGEKYRFGPDDDYWMASLVFQWTLYDGSQTKAKKAQSAIDKKRLETRLTQMEKQILLEVKNSFHSLKAAEAGISASLEREKSAGQSFTIVEKKFGYGTASQLEFIDARTTFTQASISAILAKFDYLISRTDLERAAALINLEEYQ